ncbi:hypothetical protein RX329_36630 [Bradyrhizobium sp. BWC-3-1]|nr:hypothetical protein [Bradyrhizobium sp. BWC-3-1]WOH57642.1 hypothetical protein RX329_36630 [Bradyrhizobium sp. BWC-3-1]
MVALTRFYQVTVSSDKSGRLTASTREALSERVFGAVVVDRYFVPVATNLLDCNQDNATTFHLKAGIWAATVIDEVYVFTTKVSIAIDLYRSLGCLRIDHAFELFYDISPRYGFFRKQAEPIYLGSSNVDAIWRLTNVISLAHDVASPI